MFQKKKEENKKKIKRVLHDTKMFLYGVATSTGLIIGFTLGIIVGSKK